MNDITTNDNKYQIINNSEQDKQTLLAKLFALRIAVGSIYQKSEECYNLKYKCHMCEGRYSDQVNIYNNALETATKNHPEEKLEIKKKDHFWLYVAIGIAVAAVGIIISCILGASIEGYEVMFFIGGSLLSLGLGVGAFFLVSSVLDKKFDKKAEEEYKIAKEIYDNKRAKIILKESIEIENKSRAEMTALHNEYMLIEPKLQAMSKAYQDEYDATCKLHVNLLLPADWERLDYIIFALQSGRADTLKEALRYSDEQVRHEQIMSTLYAILDTIHAQTNAIISTLKECTQNAINSFEDCKQVLDATISKSTSDMAKSMANASRVLAEKPTQYSVLIKMNDVTIKA